MNYLDKYHAWLEEKNFDDEFIAELKAIDEDDLEEFFYKELEFGTAGLRGINGAGSNRMNKYVIRRATQGYAQYLISKNPENPSCAIAYDNRRFSKFFSLESARVLAANGVKTYLYKELRPTPQLSFTVIEMKTTGGIVLTASHNPPEYSGYKVYGSDGAQLNTEEALKVSQEIQNQNGFSDIKIIDFEEGEKTGLIEWIPDEMDTKYIKAVEKSMIHQEVYKYDFKTLYTPLHGAGTHIMKKLFEDIDIPDANYLKLQMIPDPEFTTCKSPNPENVEAFKFSKIRGKEIGAKMLLASDPDADRLGLLLRNNENEYVKIDGNQIGALLAYYVFSEKEDLGKAPCLVKSIVSSSLTEKIATDHNVQFRDTLTGFKNICGLIRQFEKDGTPNFVMGFEESYGYLVGTHARDKDSFVSAMLMIEMAKFYASRGKTLFDVLDEIYQKYGYYKDHLIALKREGKSGMQEISDMMTRFRDSFIEKSEEKPVRMQDFKISKEVDYVRGTEVEIDMESSNVLKYYFEDGSWFALRPSGTEPKIKFYFSANAKTEEAADDRLQRLLELVRSHMD